MESVRREGSREREKMDEEMEEEEKGERGESKTAYDEF